jgi:hypothetical protein
MDAEFHETVEQTLVLATVVGVITACLDFAYWQYWFRHHPWLNVALLIFALGNNSYQVATHVMTALKFVGVKLAMIPGGARDDQTVINFTFHNQLDLWGWWAYFIVRGHANLLYNILASVHIAVGIIAFLYPKIFQKYYISTNHNTLFFHILKTVFVVSDAVCRSWALWSWLADTIEPY